MIVYGDPQYSTDLTSVMAQVRRAGAARNLDDLRFLLILCGQLEQAAADSLSGQEASSVTDGTLSRLQQLTDFAADAFVREYFGENPDAALSKLQNYLADFSPCCGRKLRIKAPEGFAFYNLYPEQYVVAAQHWARAQPKARTVVVAGVLSIGSSLSAVVKAALERRGRRVLRLTVRPTGPPFERHVELNADGLGGSDWTLVVDEGPGLSGSSMAATAEALVRAGIRSDRISFLPGHGGEPGGAGNPAARAWWGRAERFVASGSDLRWEGLTLTERLAYHAKALTGEEVVEVQDLGGGLWRRAAYSSESDWPPAFAPFERAKYRCVLATGDSILWKFAGLAAVDGSGRPAYELDFARQSGSSESGWAPRPLGTALGFVATPWIEGKRLRRADITPALLRTIGGYLNTAAGNPLSEEEALRAHERLSEMCYWNLLEARDESSATRARRRFEALSPGIGQCRYGHGRTAPHEWVLTRDGALIKTDMTGHDRDHTVIGPQPLIWDVAGASIEWDLSAQQLKVLASEMSALTGSAPAPLDAYRLAYAAFRLGMCTFCASSTEDGDERRRLEVAAADYKRQAMRLLDD